MVPYNDMSKYLVSKIPELASEYEKEIVWWNPEFPGDLPGQHVIFGDIFRPFLTNLLKATNENKELLRRIFSIIEEFANSNDQDVLDLVDITVCENIINDTPEALRKSESRSLLLGRKHDKYCRTFVLNAEWIIQRRSGPKTKPSRTFFAT